MLRKTLAAALLASVCFAAPEVLAQTTTPFGATAGSGLNFCAYKPDATNLAGCEVKYVWNGSAWVLEPADASGHPQVSVPLQNIQFNGGSAMSIAGATGTSNVYAAGTALCTSGTVGTCNTALSTLYFTLPTGTIHVTGGTLRISDTLSTAWAANSQITVDLFSAAATLNAGDGSAYKIATGTALYEGSLLCTTSLGEQNDGVSFKCNPIGGPLDINLGSANAHLFATFWTNTGTGVVTAPSNLFATLAGTY